MGLGGSLVVKAAALAAVPASSLPGIPLCPVIHRRLVGPGPAFRRDIRRWVTGDRRSIALRSDLLCVYFFFWVLLYFIGAVLGLLFYGFCWFRFFAFFFSD